MTSFFVSRKVGFIVKRCLGILSCIGKTTIIIIVIIII